LRLARGRALAGILAASIVVALATAASALAQASVETGVAGQVTPTSATLRATVNPQGETVTDCHFEYGTSSEFGASVPCSPSPGSGTSPVAVAGTVEGLSEETEYDFRVVATSEGGTVYGGVQSFETFPAESAPEFGQCVKIPAGTGTFGNKTCTTRGGEQTYEWYPAFGSKYGLGYNRFKIEIKSLTQVELRGVGGQTITCTGEREVPVGEHTSNKTIGEVILTFSGCHLGEAGSCQSGETAGQVATTMLKGELGIISESPKGAAHDKVGLEFESESGEAIAWFSCAGTPVVVTGSVIGEVKANVMTKRPPLKFVIGKTGVQQPAHFLAGSDHFLFTQLGGGPFERSPLSFTATLNESTEEISSVL
jgi:hypothetical protein